MLGPPEIFTLFFVTLGPLKTIVPFAIRTQGIPEQRVQHIAVRAFVIATLGIVAGVLFGQFLGGKCHISLLAMTLASGRPGGDVGEAGKALAIAR